MHRILMGDPDKLMVDHINSNGLDNRRANLRLATHAENNHNQRLNCRNKSGFKGVFFHKRAGRWTSQIMIDGRSRHLGLFDTPEDAHAAYIEAAKRLHGEFARFA